MIELESDVSLRPYTTLRAGGRAHLFTIARTADSLAETAYFCQDGGLTMTTLGWGSNVLPSDDGVPHVVAINATKAIQFGDDGELECESGVAFQELFLKTAQRGWGGLEFAVGIPGSVGGALVSNAGAYRSNISEFVTEVEIVFEKERRWEPASWMEFSYRDSRLRKDGLTQCVITRVRMKLPQRDRKAIFDEAREYQRQRISKQPPPASAGSFFKNVNDHELAASLRDLPEGMKQAGVVPAGFLIERANLMGTRIGGAMFARKHANFIVNVAGATATDIRNLACLAKAKVREQFGAELEEEVLYLGDWSRFEPETVL